MTATEVFEGGCLCGSIRYRSLSAPVRGVICHCGMCRRHSGAPALAFVHFPLESFSWLDREPARYRSSKFAERGFCVECGSTITMHEEVLESRVQIAVGSLDQAALVQPDDHVWTEFQLPWFDIKDTLPRFARNSASVDTKAETATEH